MSENTEHSTPVTLVLTPILAHRLVGLMGAGTEDATALGRLVREDMADFVGSEHVAMPLIRCLLGAVRCPLSDADAGTLIGFLLSVDGVIDQVLEVHNASVC